MSRRALVVSVHDVSPLTRDSVDSILGDLAGWGVSRVSLLVIPDHHCRGNIAADPAFGAWLRGLVAAGHEAVLHGYAHQRERRAHESASTRFFTRFYTAGEGEFFDIAYNDARALLSRGRDALTQCAGVSPAGFIAPAWLLSAGGEEAARNLGFEYTTRLKSVSDLASRRVHRSQSLCWSVRSRWRRVVSLGWNRLLFQALRPNPLLRLSIHPPDIGHPAIWRQVRLLASEALADREPITYQEFITRWRAGDSPSMLGA
jgi:predicted deacetylase